jgi:hypothetical protein
MRTAKKNQKIVCKETLTKVRQDIVLCGVVELARSLFLHNTFGWTVPSTESSNFIKQTQLLIHIPQIQLLQSNQ